MTGSDRDPDLDLRIESIVQERGGAWIDRAHLRADLRGLIAWDRARRAAALDHLPARIAEAVLARAGVVSWYGREWIIAIVRQHLDAAKPERER